MTQELTTTTSTAPAIRLVWHDVIAEIQPHGDYLVMYEDGTVKHYANKSCVVAAIKRRDRHEADERGGVAVMTRVEWRS